VPHGAPADERSIAFFKQLREIGFDATLLSNNKQARVEMFNEPVGVHMIWKANKPSAKGYQEAMRLMNTDETSTVFVGDQLFTDVWGAKNAKIHSFLVKPMNPKEEIQIVIKRRLEAVVLHFYLKKNHMKTKGE
jgi:HAD superfamily phosphatase (TIGR01668 family)